MDTSAFISIAIVSVVFFILPAAAISYAMTSKNSKWQVRGYYGLAAVLALFAFSSFYMATTGVNRGGYVWMLLLTYGSYWAWGKATEIRSR